MIRGAQIGKSNTGFLIVNASYTVKNNISAGGAIYYPNVYLLTNTTQKCRLNPASSSWGIGLHNSTAGIIPCKMDTNGIIVTGSSLTAGTTGTISFIMGGDFVTA